MSIRRFTLILLGFVVCSAQAEVAFDGGWTIVQRQYPAEIGGLTQGIHWSAAVLKEALKESLDVDAPIVYENRAPKGPGHRIFMGEPFAEAAGLLPKDFKGWDWGIAEKDGDIYLFGRDRAGATPKCARGCILPSALAAIQFMRQQMGVLFLMPGRTGREIPRIDRLVVPTGFFRRGSVEVPYGAGRFNEFTYDIANAIYGLGTFHTYGGHTYPEACPPEKYRATHPEYFARNEKGENVWSAQCQAYCVSNPEFQKLVHDEMIRQFDAGADVVELGQNDGNAGVCRCPGCKALYGTDDWGEKLWCFHRDLAAQIQKERPGKIVQIISYSNTSKPPKSFKVFPGNVMIECARDSEEDLALWDGYTVPHGFTYYIYNWGYYHFLGFTPKCAVGGLVGQVKRFRRRGLKGVYRCGFGEMFGMEGPAYWVYNHLLEDAATDVPACLATYYRGAFGPAADAMKRFYEDLEEPLSFVSKRRSIEAEDLVEATIKRSKDNDPIGLLAHVYTPDRVARMDAALAEAERAPGLSEKQIRRLKLVRIEWNYVRNIGSIAYFYNEFCKRPTLAGRDAILARLDERKEIVDWIYRDGKVRRLEEWPEILLFGGAPMKDFLRNGVLQAPIKEPLTWDVAKMRKYRIVPSEMMTPEERKAEIAATPGMKPVRNFVFVHKPKGSSFTPYADGSGFTLSQGPSNQLVSAYARLRGAKDGIRPNATYRVSWLINWKHVRTEKWWHGFSFAVEYDREGEERKELKEPGGDRLHTGSSAGWVRESIVFNSNSKPDFEYQFIFRFWGGTDGLVDVRDVMIEELNGTVRIGEEK